MEDIELWNKVRYGFKNKLKISSIIKRKTPKKSEKFTEKRNIRFNL